MRKTSKRLSLTAETIRALSDTEAKHAAGGWSGAICTISDDDYTCGYGCQPTRRGPNGCGTTLEVCAPTRNIYCPG